MRDNGIGIAADQLPRIFEMFMQVDTSLERSSGGLGIGLTLVKNLVEMHGGTVEAHSDGARSGQRVRGASADLGGNAPTAARADRRRANAHDRPPHPRRR